MNMPQVLITGGLGFIGMECCNQFLQHGWTVQILDIKTPTLSQQNWIERNGVLFIQGDIRVADDVERSLSGCSAVVNLAAQVSVQRSMALPEETKDINVNGLDVLLKHTIANNVSSFIQASSAAVYGNPTELPLAETAEIECLSPYAESKWENEIQIRTSRDAGLNAISLRFFNVFGPNQNNDSNYASVIPVFIHRMLQGNSPIIYGNGEQTRDFIHVHDVAKTIFSMVDGGISFEYSEVNVCSGKRYSLLHLVNCINGVLLSKGIIKTAIQAEFEPAREGDIIDSQGDNRRLGAMIEVSIGDDIVQGISDIIEYRTNSRDSA